MPDDPIPDPDHVREFRKYRRHLPHWQRPGAMHYLTFSLERPSPVDLSRPRVAPLIIQALQHWHEDRYKLHDFVVMPDHVHVLLEPLEYERGFVSLQRITHSIKTWTAAQINRELRRDGTLWEEETFDHVVRGPGDLRKIRDYIWLNPVRAELVERPTEWPWWGKGMFVRAPTSTNGRRAGCPVLRTTQQQGRGSERALRCSTRAIRERRYGRRAGWPILRTARQQDRDQTTQLRAAAPSVTGRVRFRHHSSP